MFIGWPHRWLEVHGAALGRRDAVCVLTHDHMFLGACTTEEAAIAIGVEILVIGAERAAAR